jgi:mannose-6-phosphate isomerase-like protein (cupin superfamily)
VAYTVFRRDELEFDTPSGGDERRGIVRLSDAMSQMRANLWRMPAGSRGRRHAERVQEEIFFVVDGTATLALGEPAERVELSSGSLAVVEPGTAVQVLNEGEADSTILIIGAPPVPGEADYLPGVD